MKLSRCSSFSAAEVPSTALLFWAASGPKRSWRNHSFSSADDDGGQAGAGSSQRIGRTRQEPGDHEEARTRTVSFHAGAHGTSVTAVEPCTNRRTLIEWNALSDAEAERCCDRNVGERESAHDELAITEAVLEHVEMQ